MSKVFRRFISVSFSVYNFHIHSNLICIFSTLRTEHFYISSRCMDHVFMAKIFRFQLRHRSCLIKLTLLQLHHRTSLTTLTFIKQLHLRSLHVLHLHSLHLIHLLPLPVLHLRSPHVLISFMTRAPNWYYSILTFRYIFQYLFTYKFNQFLNLLIYQLIFPHSLISSTHLPSPNSSGTLWLYYFSPTTSKLTQDRNQLIKTQCFAAYVPIKLIVDR